MRKELQEITDKKGDPEVITPHEEKGLEEEKKGGPGGMPGILKKVFDKNKDKEEKPEVPPVDPKRVDEIEKRLDVVEEDVKDLKGDVEGLEETDNDLQKQIDDLKKEIGKKVPLYLIPLVICAVALVAAYYSSQVSFNPVRTAMFVAGSVVSMIVTIALYLKKSN